MAAVLLAMAVGSGATAFAADPSIANSGRAGAADAYWTAARMQAAQPLPLPQASSTRATAGGGTASRIQAGAASFQPATEPKAGAIGRFEGIEGDASPRSVGTSGLPFSNTRVFPDSAVSTFPNRLAGKLFFTKPGVGDFICSASIHSRRLIITAGHCVYDAVNRRFYTNFIFVPAYTNNSRPFGSWSWSYVITTGQWASGGGGVPNISDFGLLVASDQFIASAVRKIGDYLGWFGWQTRALVGKHISAIGYPANLDSGQRMQLNTAEVRARGTIAGEIGSAMAGGASGGPWVQDHGVQASGQTVSSTGPNRVVGITSYGPAEGNTPRQYLGSSILNDDFIRIRTTACGRTAGNC